MTDFIKEFWDNQAKIHGQNHLASWGDNWAIDLEIRNIAHYIKKGDKVLDVGCANGFSTFEQGFSNLELDITGVDFSSDMIQEAKKTLEGKQYNLCKGASHFSFLTADVRRLPFDTETFDVTYTTRCLINLPNWEDQIKGIEECVRVTKKGGIIILSEAFYEPLVLLNAMRQLVQLKPLVEHDFNRYLKKSKVINLLEGLWADENIEDYTNIDFSSVYYLGSRFLKDLIDDKTVFPGYSHPINQIFYSIEKDFSGGGFGIQQAYIITK